MKLALKLVAHDIYLLDEKNVNKRKTRKIKKKFKKCTKHGHFGEKLEVTH